MAIILTLAVILFILAFVLAFLNHRRESRERRRISDPRLKPLQLVVTEGFVQLKDNDQKSRALSVPVELAKPTREYYIGEARPLILSSTDLKV
jgi:hypothetical protein